MSDTPKVSAAEALAAAKLVDRVMRSDFWLWQDHGHPPTQAALRAIQSVRAFLESAASRPEGKVLREGWASVGRDGRESSIYWFADDVPVDYRVAKYPGERIVRLRVTELPEEEKENG